MSGTPAAAAEIVVAAVVAGLRLPQVVEPRQQALRLVELVPRRPQVRLRRLAVAVVALAPRAVVVAADVAVARSPACRTPMAPSTPHSSKWLAMRTACRQ